MDDNSIVTQCPVCLTQFRVTNGQLKIASGQVRCGACLHVFNAIKNSLSIPRHPTGRPEKEASGPQQVTDSHQQKASPEQYSAPSPVSVEAPPKSQTHKAAHRSVPDTHIPSLTASIEAETVVLGAPEITSKPVPFSGLLACSFAAALLCAQVLWFKRVDLYWAYPQLQSGYDLVCHYIECGIPPQQDLTLIRNQRIIITPSARYEDAVDLTLILLNEAHFAQPFPALKLEFSDLKGRRVAQRVFQPRDYLPDATQITPFIPSQQPVQITLEIRSPGPRAVNYQLDLLAPRL